jgi:hypothetical protein
LFSRRAAESDTCHRDRTAYDFSPFLHLSKSFEFRVGDHFVASPQSYNHRVASSRACHN